MPDARIFALLENGARYHACISQQESRKRIVVSFLLAGGQETSS